MGNQILRNLKGYFRNKTAFFCSFSAMFIMLVIYGLFLMDMIVSQLSIKFISSVSPVALVTAWLMGGVLIVNAINATMGALDIIVADEESLKIKDFTISSFPTWKLVLSYIISSFISGMIVCLVTLIFAYLFILLIGKTVISFIIVLKIIPCVILSVLLTSAIVTFLFSFLKKMSSITLVSVMTGALIGFLVGAYVPIGQLPPSIQVIMKFIPFTYITALMRSILMSDLTPLFIAGSGGSATTSQLDTFMGSSIKWFDFVVPNWLCVVIVIAVSVLFFALAVLKMSLKKRKA